MHTTFATARPATIRATRRGPGGFLHRLVHAIRAHLRGRRDFQRLQQLPDYLLDDVGLTRAEINSRAGRPLF